MDHKIQRNSKLKQLHRKNERRLKNFLKHICMIIMNPKAHIDGSRWSKWVWTSIRIQEWTNQSM